MTKAQLESMSLVAPALPRPELPASPFRCSDPPRRKAWPSYERCLEGAPESSSGGKKRSTADFTFCCIAIDHFRRTLEETAAPGRLCTPSALALVGAPASFTRNCMTHPPRA